MKSWQIHQMNTQLQQASQDHMICLEQLNKIPKTATGDIAALKTCIYALLNANEMFGAVCDGLISQLASDD